MSKYVDYELACEEYDNNRAAAGSDVMCALMQFYCRKQLKDLHVLDAGCGTGNFTKALLEHGIGHITLLDASPGMLKFAKRKLENDLDVGNIHGVVQAIFPPLPFCDESFDAVMFNSVLNHLDKAGDNHFPTCVEALREARRTLKTGGIIVISTLLKSTATNNFWPAQLVNSLHEKWIQRFPSLEQFEEMFNRAGISCKHKLNLLGADVHPTHYTNPESTFSHFLHHAEATEAERVIGFQALKELKQKGELNVWIKEHDKAMESGILTIFVCTTEEKTNN